MTPDHAELTALSNLLGAKRSSPGSGWEPATRRVGHLSRHDVGVSAMNDVGTLLIGAGFSGVGCALALNFKGFTEWHVRSTFKLMSGFESLSRSTSEWERERRVRLQVRLERLIGVVFAAAGLFLLGRYLVDLTR